MPYAVVWLHFSLQSSSIDYTSFFYYNILYVADADNAVFASAASKCFSLCRDKKQVRLAVSLNRFYTPVWKTGQMMGTPVVGGRAGGIHRFSAL